jgi:hypothetical protein
MPRWRSTGGLPGDCNGVTDQSQALKRRQSLSSSSSVRAGGEILPVAENQTTCCSGERLVRKGGVEPPWVSPPDPKSGASANSATFARGRAFLNSKGRRRTNDYTVPSLAILLTLCFHPSTGKMFGGTLALLNSSSDYAPRHPKARGFTNSAAAVLS